MKRRTFLASVVSIAGAAWLAGCGGGGGSSSPNPAGRGAAEGFVFSAADGSLRVFNTAAAGLAAGLRVASGARAQIVGGPSVSIGSDGALRLSGIEPGRRTLRLSAGGSTRDIPLTVIPDATLPLGETPVNRQAAAAALKAFATTAGVSELFEGADVLISSTPLPAGIVLTEALIESADPLTLTAPSWLVYVDREPGARFGHLTTIALVDAASGAVTGIDSLSWPALNGASFYADSTVNATSPDAAQIATRRINGPVAASARKMSPSRGTRENCRAADPDTSRTHVLMVQGSSRSDFGADMDVVDQFLRSSPFPRIGTLKKLKTFEHPWPGRDRLLSDFAEVRDACKSGDTFVLYITAHGLMEKYIPEPTEGFDGQRGGLPFRHVSSMSPEEIAADYRLSLEAAGTFGVSMTDEITKYKGDLIEPSLLDFTSCKACRIILWIDTCYSGNWIPLLRSRLEALPEPKRDILILTAADQHRLSWGVRVENQVQSFQVFGETMTTTPGGIFSQNLQEGAQRLLEAGTVETGADLLDLSFAFAKTATTEYNRIDKYNWYSTPQNPQLFRRPLDPEDVCGRGNQEVTIK